MAALAELESSLGSARHLLGPLPTTGLPGADQLGMKADIVIADRTYNGQPCRNQIRVIGAEAEVPPHLLRSEPKPWDRG